MSRVGEAKRPQARRAEAAHHERRKAVRKAVQADVQLRAPGRRLANVKLVDLSTHGCQIAIDDKPVCAGQFVAIHLPDAEPSLAVIRWVQAGKAGLEFAQPIPEALADAIAAAGPPATARSKSATKA
jgi:hypothetical protein